MGGRSGVPIGFPDCAPGQSIPVLPVELGRASPRVSSGSRITMPGTIFQVERSAACVDHIIGDHHRLGPPSNPYLCRSRYATPQHSCWHSMVLGARFKYRALLVRQSAQWALAASMAEAAPNGNHAVMFAGFQRPPHPSANILPLWGYTLRR